MASIRLEPEHLIRKQAKVYPPPYYYFFWLLTYACIITDDGSDWEAPESEDGEDNDRDNSIGVSDLYPFIYESVIQLIVKSFLAFLITKLLDPKPLNDVKLTVKTLPLKRKMCMQVHRYLHFSFLWLYRSKIFYRFRFDKTPHMEGQ